MQQLFNIYYKEVGAQRVQNLANPKIIDFISFPRSSVYHHLTHDESKDLDASKLYYKGYSSRIAVDYVTESDFLDGGARRVNFVIKTAVKSFHINNKAFQYRPDAIDVIRDPNVLIVQNYNYLNDSVKYMMATLTPYYTFKNQYSTLLANINRLCGISDRQHFMFIDVPRDIPHISILESYKDKVNSGLLTLFETREKLLILELYKWLSYEDHDKSIFSKLEDKHLGKINIVFFNKTRKATVINLGYLSSWIKGHENLTAFSHTVQLEDVQLQKVFIHFLITVNITEDVEEIDIPDAGTISGDGDDEESIPGQIEVGDAYMLGNTSSIKQDTSDKQSEISDDIDDGLNAAEDLDKMMAQVDDDLNTLEKANQSKLAKKGIQVNGDGSLVETLVKKEYTEAEVNAEVFGNKTYQEKIKLAIDAAADTGRLSAADYKKLIKSAEAFDSLPDPYGSKQTMSSVNTVTVEDIQLKPNDTAMVVSDMVTEKYMSESSLQTFDKAYIKNVLKKDMLMMVTDLQQSGVIVTNYEVETNNSALGAFEVHELHLKPVDGMPSTLRFRVPVINEDGTFTAGGNKYSMRKQRVDVPIRKIDPITVALTSYYGKTFVAVSDKKANSTYDWILRNISKLSIMDNPIITDIGPANVYNNAFKAPYLYSFLSQNYKTFKIAGNLFSFDERDRETMFTDYASIEKNGNVVCGFTPKIEPIVMTVDEEFLIVRGGGTVSLGSLENILKIDKTKAPVDFTELRVFGKTIPVGVVLGYYIGLPKLLKLTKATYRIVEGRKQKDLQPHEYALTFADVSYIFSRKERSASLILSGFLEYEKIVKQYTADSFANKDVYFNLFDSKSMSSLYIRELDIFRQLFVDGITRTILLQMDMPTTFEGLLVRATELLTTYDHPDSQDLRCMRIRGYERIAGAVYSELATSIRQFRNKNISGRSKVDMSPFAVWSKIMKDAAIKIVEDINPIQNMKESEIVTYAGEGGRSKEAMNKESRAFHESDIGVISEASVDSTDVGINFYLSANPNFKDMRGLVKDSKNINPASMVSTSVLLAPGSSNDDVKRVNFIQIQQAHTIACRDYQQPMIRTGYEYVVANRTTDMFAFNADQDGKVISVDDKGIIVEFKNGDRRGVELGRLYGKAEGSVYPHDVMTGLKPGQSFSKGDNVAYNTGFFEADLLDPKRVVMKNSMTIRVALMETTQTHEDSCAISSKVSGMSTAKTTKMKSVTVSFKQNIHNVAKAGQDLMPNDIMMVLEDEITSTGQFDEASLDVLSDLSKQAVKSKYIGKLDKIEVLYHGSKDDMSPSLKALADKSDKDMAVLCKATGKPVITGEVNGEYRVSGTKLGVDKAEIKLYITISTLSGVGDKLVFANQMKSVISEVMDYKVHTESGQEIDAIFGVRSIMARVVNSPFIIGTTTTLLKKIAEKAVQIYKG
jgi:hypothetical protein